MDNFADLPMRENMDGKDYFFKAFTIVQDTPQDILADAIGELGEVTHVRLTSDGVVNLQVNGIPVVVANGKTVPAATMIGLTHALISAWEARMLFTSLMATSNSGSPDIEVEYWNTHS